jgi:predicted  nucleic acid-binding Zn-ribbon protein
MKALSYQKKILDEVKDLPEEQMPNLLKIIRIFKDSIKKQKNEFEDLKKEFKEWDKLSDEALDNFERTITLPIEGN